MFKQVAGGVGAMLWLVLVAGCAGDAADPPAEAAVASVQGIPPEVLENLPPGVTAEMVEQGRQAFVVCAVCHGFDGEGTSLGPSLRDSVWLQIDGTSAGIERVIRSGVPDPVEYPVPMPALGGGAFDAEEMKALTAYVDVLGRAAEVKVE